MLLRVVLLHRTERTTSGLAGWAMSDRGTLDNS